jgi:hypothetical protein
LLAYARPVTLPVEEAAVKTVVPLALMTGEEPRYVGTPTRAAVPLAEVSSG